MVVTETPGNHGGPVRCWSVHPEPRGRSPRLWEDPRGVLSVPYPRSFPSGSGS